MSGLAHKIIAIHEHLDAASVPHAFGGALALAWCTGRARGTIDIDVNVFLDPTMASIAVAALPTQVAHDQPDLDTLGTDGQVRLWWDRTPVDLFMNTTPYHREVSRRARVEDFDGHAIPFLACSDLAVFKAFFNRTKDWADIEEMLAAGTVDVERVLGVLVLHLGADDERVDRLALLA